MKQNISQRQRVKQFIVTVLNGISLGIVITLKPRA